MAGDPVDYQKMVTVKFEVTKPEADVNYFSEKLIDKTVEERHRAIVNRWMRIRTKRYYDNGSFKLPFYIDF